MSEPARGEPTSEPAPAPHSLQKPSAGAPGLEKPIRASDAERERVAEIVRRAVGDGRLTLVEGDERLAGIYASIHRGELATFTSDLGEGAPVSTPDPVHRSPVATRQATTSSVAVMSGAVRRGDWTPGHTHVAVAVMGGVELRLRDARLGDDGLAIDAIAIMGGIEIDLRGADLGRHPVTVRAVAVMGGVEVLVDPDTRVEEHGVGFMGAFADESGAPARPDGPVVRVTGFAMMGGVSIERRRPGVDGEGRPELRDGDERRGIHGGH